MTEELTSPQEEEAPKGTQTFTLPDATRARIMLLFQERQTLDVRIGDQIQSVMDALGLVSGTPPSYDVSTGMVTYTLMLAPLPMNRQQRRRDARKR